MTSAAPAAPPAGSVDPSRIAGPPFWRILPSRVVTLCLVEMQKLRHDRTELVTRAVQPALWLLVFGETFTRLHAIPVGGISYLDFLAPGIIAQSALFVAIFYGIQIIWDRDAGVLAKLLVTPAPRAALVTGKAFAAGVRALAQAVVVLVLSVVLGVALSWNPLDLLGTAAVVMLAPRVMHGAGRRGDVTNGRRAHVSWSSANTRRRPCTHGTTQARLPSTASWCWGRATRAWRQR